jgi:hypothetical protein
MCEGMLPRAIANQQSTSKQSTADSSGLHKKSQIHGYVENRGTLKALANVSPGFALKPWGSKMPERLFATLKGLRSFAFNKHRGNSFRVAPSKNEMRFPGLPKHNPGLEFANAFSVIHFG